MVPEETCLVDIARKFHPERKGMYTCACSPLSLQMFQTYHIYRLEFEALRTRLQLWDTYWLRFGHTWPCSLNQLEGSDHYPVYLDLHDKIVGQDGVTLKLKDLLLVLGKTRVAVELLRWQEGRYPQSLTDIYNRTGACYVNHHCSRASRIVYVDVASPTSDYSSIPGRTNRFTTFGSSIPDLPVKASEPSNATHPRSKRKRISPEPSSVKISEIQSSNEPAKKLEPGPSRLSTFSSQPGSSGVTSKAKGKGAIATSGDVDMLLEESSPHENTEDAYYRLALELSSSQVSLPYPSSSQKQKEAGDAWKSPMASIQLPRCTVQNEVAKELTVNKPGVNKGKRSFVCSRPVGPGYDKGRAERLREDVDPQYKCNFFEWSSDVRREMRQGG
ncbi:Class II abasic (AP) endonuclease [Marasmius sp. AFHP31]|nr:Class II abasic (AP) endonuclease [Marasmius sp. AFHP31]